MIPVTEYPAEEMNVYLAKDIQICGQMMEKVVREGTGKNAIIPAIEPLVKQGLPNT